MKTDYLFDYNGGLFHVTYNETKSLRYDLYDANGKQYNYGILIIKKEQTFKELDEIFASYDELYDEIICEKLMEYLRLDKSIFTDE